MKKFLGKLVIPTCLAAVFGVGAIAGVAAAGDLTEITANLNRAISIVFNGEKKELTDAQGVTVYPISYNGTTYVPVRAVSGIFGETVEWDGETNSVYLGSREKQPISLVDLGFAGNEYTWLIRENAELTVPGSEGDVTFKNGIIFKVWNATASTSGYTQVGWDIPVNYKTLTFTTWSPDKATVKLFDKDHKTVLYSFELPANAIVSKEINIEGVEHISLGADGTLGSKPFNVKFFEPTIK